MIVMQVLPVIK